MTRKKQIILISLDTLRADHLGCHGYPRNTSPTIDTLAGEGIFFKNAFSPSSFTIPAHASIFTGKYPSHHSIGFDQVSGKLNTDIDITLAEYGKTKGLKTAAFVSSCVLRKQTSLDSGFDLYDDEMTSREQNRPDELIRDGSETCDRAIAWIRNNKDDDFFVFLHLFDVHGPYVCKEPYQSLFIHDAYNNPSEILDAIVPDSHPIGGIPAYQVLKKILDKEGSIVSFETRLRYYLSQYDGNIRYCDSVIRRLITVLQDLGIFDDVLLIITSDHGEAFGENNIFFFHGLTVTPEQIHVPLIVKPSRSFPCTQKRICDPVTTLDIFPTIISWFGDDPAGFEMEGRSLLGYLDTKFPLSAEKRILFSENEGQIAIIRKDERIVIKKKEIPSEPRNLYIPELIESLNNSEYPWNFNDSEDVETGMLEWTGERYLPYGDPALYGSEIHYEHLHRYAFASRFVKGKKVLDLASGEGYGTFILSRNAESVAGIEIDPAAVSHAKNTYDKKNITFLEGSILDIPIAGEKLFDVIVCFEAIEHVREHDILLKEICRLLKDDGLFIVSTPDKKHYSEDAGFKNPFHQKELYYTEFSELLQKYFSHVYISGQQVISGSSIYPLSGTENSSSSEIVIDYKDSHFSFAEKNERDPRYFIAIASNRKIDPAGIQKSYLIDKSNREFSLSSSRRDQVSELSGRAHNLEAIVADRDNRISDLSNHAHNLEAIVADRESRVSDLSNHAHNLEAIVADRESRVSELQNLAHDLEAVVSDRETQITDLRKYTHDLKTIVSDRETQIAELQKHAHDLTAIVSDRESQITEFRKHSHNLEAIITNQNQQLQEVISFNQSLVNENTSIKQSLTYNLTTKFHKKIVERLLPQNTRRRKYYDLGLSGSRLLINEGWDRFRECYSERNRPRAPSTFPSIPLPQTENVSEEPDDSTVIQTKVSVIIPTKNAGPDFESVLGKIKNQKGIAAVETIIVDSGSTDGTLEVAEKYGCRIFSIKPEEFNHGQTRNYGAEQATGEFMVFLVQDAIPIGDYWLTTMIKILKTDDHIAAASCRQVPRSDADLFACYSMWYHYTAMEFFNDKIVQMEKDRFKQLPLIEKRKLAGLDDVCSCFRKDIFDRVKFENLNFAEDLGIGIRLIEQGYKLAFLYSAGVIHSHNRDAEYFVRRYYVDSKSLAGMSGVPATPDNRDLDQVINSFNAVYQNMKNSLARIKTHYPDEIRVDQFFSALIRDLDSHDDLNAPCFRETRLENVLSEIFDLITPGPADTTQLAHEFSGILDNFRKFVRNQCDSRNTDELIENTYKFFAIYFGSHMGSLYAHHATDKTMQSIDAILRKGV